MRRPWPWPPPPAVATTAPRAPPATPTGNLSGTIRIDGSSTVAPLSEAAAELFQEENPSVRVTVGTSGTGGGFEKFCDGETDISDASRPIKHDETDACEANGIEYEELTVANDGLSVVVNPENTWAKCLTVEQLKKIWEPGSHGRATGRTSTRASRTRSSTLFGAGTDSGTFDYFTEAINGEEGAEPHRLQRHRGRQRHRPGRVAAPRAAWATSGLSYLEQNEGKVKGVEIDGGDGCVDPTTETVQDGTYKPLGRPLFIYPTAKAARPARGARRSSSSTSRTPTTSPSRRCSSPDRRAEDRLPSQARAAQAGGLGAVAVGRHRRSPSSASSRRGTLRLVPRGPGTASGSSWAVLALCALLSVATTVGHRDRPARSRPSSSSATVSLVEFFTGTEWAPLFADARSSASCRWSRPRSLITVVRARRLRARRAAARPST